MNKKYEYIRVRKSAKYKGIPELKFVNKKGLKGYELFAMYSFDDTGWKIYHFRKQINP